MPRRCFSCLLALFGALAWPAPAPAQPTITFAPLKPGSLAQLTAVTAPAARCAAVSEAHRLLAFGHDSTHPGGQLSLIRLDAKGAPAAYATPWKLPRPNALTKEATYPLSLAFHPTLPLLYVWQDAAFHYGNPPNPLPAQLKEFDHLLIYDVAKQPAELVVGLCRGKGYMYGQQGGGLALDRTGAFLYVPNVRDPKNDGYLRFGRFPLADGLPDVLGEKDRKLSRPQRALRLAERSAAGLAPPQATPMDYGYVLSFSAAGCGMSFHPLSKDAVLAGGSRGVVLWRPDDKDCCLSGLPLKKTSNTLIGAHPTLPLLFATAHATDSLFRVQHAEGYPTLLPEQWIFPDAQLLSAPAVLGKANKVAVGGRHCLYVVSLDEQGRARPEAVQVRVFNPQVRALVYSERFERLYVSVELSR